MTLRVCLVLAAGFAVAGCGRDAALRCENSEVYGSEVERAPIRIPDDLKVPEQNDALRIPPLERAPTDASPPPGRPCLESPPDYYEGLEQEGSDLPPADGGPTP